jgi:hypothetical protein
MYEMEGASPGYVALGSPVARFTWRHAPPAGPEFPRDVPVSQYFPRPGVTPGRFPFPTVKVFLLLSPPSRKGLREFILGFFVSTRYPQKAHGCPHVASVIHRLMHSSSTSYTT